MHKLAVYTINTGLFIKPVNFKFYPEWSINGVNIENMSTRKGGFIFLEGAQTVTTLSRTVDKPRKRIAFMLSDSTLTSEKIPRTLQVEEVEEFYNDDIADYDWKNYKHIKSLYKPVYAELEQGVENLEFEIDNIGSYHIENISDPINMKITMQQQSGWNTKTVESDLANVVSYSELELLLTPEFLLHERPCSLSSEQVYKIVREHVKTHIDRSQARITSNYDFCFDVAKLVHIKPITKHSEEKKSNGRSYAKPRIKTSSITTREVSIFSMTHDKKNYEGYPVIGSFNTNNLKEMVEQVKTYLDTLMETINMSISECPHCSGTGHIINKPVLHKA